MPLISTRGAASAQGFGEFAQSAAVNYIESCFSTYLYTGNGSTQTITNGIDLSGKGGLVWLKSRASGSYDHQFVDTARGSNKYINSNNTNAETTNTNRLTAFNADGFTLGASAQVNEAPASGYAATYVSWTFRKQAKFFDVVTYTGNGGSQTISHSLGSTPGCIIIKKLDSTTFNAGWAVYHRSLTNPSNYYLRLDTTDAQTNYGGSFISNVGTTSFDVNGASGFLGLNGSSYVAYLFAHDAGGFGLSGSDNVISCGSYTGDGAANGQLINLGYEAQWVMIKQTNASGSGWWMTDIMRGWTVNGSSGGDANLYANASSAESSQVLGQPEAQGFRPINDNVNQSGQTYIYIAIRRGPMKVPTSGTSVFTPTLQAANSTAQTKDYGFTTDSVLALPRNQTGYQNSWWSRLQGANILLSTASTAAERTSATDALIGFDAQTGVRLGVDSGSWVQNTANWVHYPFRRAPGFFDVVCYTGNGTSNTAIAHNLTVRPELIIVKARNEGTRNWQVYYDLGSSSYSRLILNTTAAATTGLGYNSSTNLYAQPTSTNILLDFAFPNTSAETYVAYLFATVAGVSKVGSYTGTGTTLQIDCGFTGGARFVLIKRTDSTGDWYVWDSARGIVSGNDPYLLLNSTAAEVTNTDYVDTYSAGFEISSTAPAAINANGGTFIFLAIA